MLKVAIVEDETEYRELLCDYLKQFEREIKEQIDISLFADGEEIVMPYSGQYDIVLMDIEMKHMDGMMTAEEIRKYDKEVIIIFITNMAQYAIGGYAVDALDYVLKPISYFAFSQRLLRARSRMKKRAEKYINIVSKTGVNKVAISEIIWIESQGHRLIYHAKDCTYVSTTVSMKEITNELSGDHFYRCNRSYLVNLAHVKAIKDSWAILSSGKVLISRSKKADFTKALTYYSGDTIK